VEFVERDVARVAAFALPDDGAFVARLAVDGSVPVQDVVGQVDLSTGIPVAKLRPLAVVSDHVVVLEELDVQIVRSRSQNQSTPEAAPLDVARGALDQFVVVVETVVLHELPDVGRLDELPGGLVGGPVEARPANRIPYHDVR